jgi:hypothetical protein
MFLRLNIILFEGMKNEKEYDKYKTEVLEYSNLISYERNKKKIKKIIYYNLNLLKVKIYVKIVIKKKL